METLLKALQYTKELRGLSSAECLAELIREVLLSDTDDPLHVNGPELIRLIDAALTDQ